MLVKPHTFRRLRAAHEKEKAEDYVELIDELIRQQGAARLTKIAQSFGVSAVTAHKILARLHREGWIDITPYRPILLTPRGKALAAKSRRRHQLVLDLLLKLGVPAAAARADAEGIEHHVSPDTLNAFARLLKRL